MPNHRDVLQLSRLGVRLLSPRYVQVINRRVSLLEIQLGNHLQIQPDNHPRNHLGDLLGNPLVNQHEALQRSLPLFLAINLVPSHLLDLAINLVPSHLISLQCNRHRDHR